MLLSLDNVGIQRSEKWLVRGVSMDINPGEIVTIIGPNGSGKSTTAKTALGIMTPDEVSCIINQTLMLVMFLKNLRSIGHYPNGQSLSSIDVSNVQKNIAAALDATETRTSSIPNERSVWR